ncbi:MAG: orotate phosphoribosyltransferase [Chloroflexi bacterium]|nr:orotate phosphoribosyltransferase [Chloroflexota bacterium]
MSELATEVGALLHGDFTLTSGRKSTYYFDAKKLTLWPEGAYLIGKVLFEELNGLGVDAVGGVATGAYPIASAVAVVSFSEGKPIPTFIVREVAKEHGTKRQIEGHLKAGWRVAMLEDVVTTGGSVLRAIKTVEEAGAKVVKVIGLVDRHEGGGDALREQGYDLNTLMDLWQTGELAVGEK